MIVAGTRMNEFVLAKIYSAFATCRWCTFMCRGGERDEGTERKNEKQKKEHFAYV